MCNSRVLALSLACIGLFTTITAAIALLIGLGERSIITSGLDKEKLFTLFCLMSFLVLIAKITSDLLLVLGAYSNNAGEMLAGLILNKITVVLLTTGCVVGALLMRQDIAVFAISCGALLIVLYAVIWFVAFKAYRKMKSFDEEEYNFVVDIDTASIHI